MKIRKTVKALTDAMYQSEIESTKITRTLRILGFQPRSICQSMEKNRNDQVEGSKKRSSSTHVLNRVEDSLVESPSCDTCFYARKVIGLEDEYSRLRLDINRLHERVTLLNDEIHRRALLS
jgi:hypothetical protein